MERILSSPIDINYVQSEQSQDSSFDYDLIIVGGGMIGGSLAIALSNLQMTDSSLRNFKVAMIEPAPIPSCSVNSTNSSVFDARALALSAGSLKILAEIGLIDSLSPYLTPIKSIHISQQGYMGLSVLKAEDIGLKCLGQCVQASDFGNVLYDSLLASNITLLQPTRCQSFKQGKNINGNDFVELEIVSTEKRTEFITARYVIAADGSYSSIRKGLGIQTHIKDYQQIAILARVAMQKEHCNVAYERFLPTGAMALLPLQGKDMKLVITAPTQEQNYWLELSDDKFIEKLILLFGRRLGHVLQISKRTSYPLQEIRPEAWFKGRVALMGNAAHSQHPIAGQGYNLGLRDVQVLVQLVSKYPNIRASETNLLEKYAAKREYDMQRVMGFTDGLIEVFKNSSPILGHLRGIGLFGLNLVPAMKKKVSHFATGLAALEKLSS